MKRSRSASFTSASAADAKEDQVPACRSQPTPQVSVMSAPTPQPDAASVTISIPAIPASAFEATTKSITDDDTPTPVAAPDVREELSTTPAASVLVFDTARSQEIGMQEEAATVIVPVERKVEEEVEKAELEEIKGENGVNNNKAKQKQQRVIIVANKDGHVDSSGDEVRLSMGSLVIDLSSQL